MAKKYEESTSNEESDAKSEKGTPRPILDERIGRFGDRLREAMSGRSVREIARMSGISGGAISDYLNGVSTPNLERLAVLAGAIGVSAKWLVFGEDLQVNEAPARYASDDFLYVPRLDVIASAGHGAIVERENERCRLAFRRDWLSKEGMLTNDLAVIEAKGDSMEPTISDGDLLLIDLSQINPAIPGIFVLRNEDALLVKRLQLDLHGQVVARSDNQAYSELVAPVWEVHVVGRAVWAGRRL